MSSEDKPPEQPEQAPVPLQLHEPVYPHGHNLPEDLIAQWVAIPAEERLYIGSLPRASLDQFLFSIGDIAAAIGNLRAGFIAYSQGQMGAADRHLQNALTRLVDGESRNRILFEEMIRSAIEVRKNAGK
ncbi:hypothetical protein [Bradyrhizobium sp. SZCCHNS2015]|uniref:hypothetical protein n=1 Tax=Bradyrhizobium sp. SZCCHNS2015 TaxID=3057305 RepID=UPI0028E6D18C|nr:hypothetical protein [Bradyrhizobium sp. SZCCHNS2015]